MKIPDPDCLGKLIGSIMCDGCPWRPACGEVWYQKQSHKKEEK
jgi:hypothetical protein